MSGQSNAANARSSLIGFCGFLCFLTLWQVVGSYHLVGYTVPPVTEVLRIYGVPYRRSLLLRAAAATSFSAGIGFVGGIALGFITGAMATSIARLRSGLDNLAVVINSVPAIALGPILIITVGREATPAVLATVSVAFLSYVAFVSGVRSGDRRLDQLFTSIGASQEKRLLYLQMPVALPAFVSSLKISTSAAFVGAVVGEWFGAFHGLGIVILNTMQNFQIPLMWAAVLLLCVLSSLMYGIFAWLELIVRRRFA